MRRRVVGIIGVLVSTVSQLKTKLIFQMEIFFSGKEITINISNCTKLGLFDAAIQSEFIYTTEYIIR